MKSAEKSFKGNKKIILKVEKKGIAKILFSSQKTLFYLNAFQCNEIFNFNEEEIISSLNDIFIEKKISDS